MATRGRQGAPPCICWPQSYSASPRPQRARHSGTPSAADLSSRVVEASRAARLIAVIDLHCHVLHGVDDGPRELEGSLEICRASAALGVKKIVATPHVSWTHDNESGDIAKRVARLNKQLRRAQIEIEVLAGAEVSISKAVEMEDEE